MITKIEIAFINITFFSIVRSNFKFFSDLLLILGSLSDFISVE